METNVMKLLCMILAVACTITNSAIIIADGSEPLFGSAAADGAEPTLGSPVAEHGESSLPSTYFQMDDGSDSASTSSAFGDKSPGWHTVGQRYEDGDETQNSIEAVNKVIVEDLLYSQIAPKRVIIRSKKPLPLHKRKPAKESKDKKNRAKGLYIKLELIYVPDELMRGPASTRKQESGGSQQVNQQTIKVAQQRNGLQQDINRQTPRRVRRVVREL